MEQREAGNNGSLLKWMVGVLTSLLVAAILALSSQVWGWGERIERLDREQAVMKRDLEYLKETARETNDAVRNIRLTLEERERREDRRR